MKEEGEFKKRIAVFMGHPEVYHYKNHAFLIAEPRINEMIEDAKKEFYDAIYPLIRQNLIQSDIETLHSLEMCIKKWFGDGGDV